MSCTATTGSSDGERILPEGWVDHGRTFVAHERPRAGRVRLRPALVDVADFPGSIAAHGYEGQYIVVVPDRELVVVHLGKTAAAVRKPLIAQLHELVLAC